MSNFNNRLAKLESAAGVGQRMKYMCVIMTGWAAGWDTAEERAKGYKIQPYTIAAGGTGGEPFYLKTEAELNEFAARPDVSLVILEIGATPASEVPEANISVFIPDNGRGDIQP